MTPDNKTGQPREHYQKRFAASEPEELSARSGIVFEHGAFHTVFLGEPVRVLWPSMEAESDSGVRLPSTAEILLGRLLLEGVLTPGSERFLSYSELPWGSVYHTQFTGRCIRRLASGYGSCLEKFRRDCLALGGRELSGADAAYEIVFLPGLRIRLLLWEGDEEFPASAQILFSDNFSAAFTAEDIAVAVDLLLSGMKNRSHDRSDAVNPKQSKNGGTIHE